VNSNLLKMDKPEDCPICYVKLGDEKNPLECGHWMHITCVQKHFKPECPLCRHPLNIKVSGTRPQPDILLFAPTEEKEEENIQGNVQGFGFFITVHRGIVGNVVEHYNGNEYLSRKRNYDDEDDEDEPWRRKGYQYREEDSDYDEENPRNDNWEYDEENVECVN
jgi:hypothetical protein